MHVPPTMLAHAVALLGLAMVWPLAAAETPGSPASPFEGTWHWTFTMPDGTITRPKLALTAGDGQVAGTTSFRQGTETPITNAVIQGSELRYQVVRRRHGQKVLTSYSGTLTDGVIKGTIESLWAGEKRVFDWEARRPLDTVNGVWRWTNSFFRGSFGGGRGFESRVELRQDGDKITGQTIPRFGSPTPITEGVITNGIVYFEIDRLIFETRSLIKHSGKLDGNIILGTLESEVEGEDRVIDWRATRTE